MDLSQGHLRKVSSLSDGGWKLEIVTQELSIEQAATLMLAKQEGITDFKIPTTSEEEPKSKSQRLKACIYRIWEKNYQATYKDSNVFYDSYMDKMIQNAKDKI